MSHARCCCKNYSGGKASAAVKEYDGECLSLLNVRLSKSTQHIHSHTLVPTYKNRPLHKSMPKSPQDGKLNSPKSNGGYRAEENKSGRWRAELIPE